MSTIRTIEENKYLDNWTVKHSADNATATATKAASAGATHFITSVSAGFSTAATKLLQIKDGATVIVEYPVVNADVIALPAPIKATTGNAVSAVLAASGGAGNVGYVNLFGFTI